MLRDRGINSCLTSLLEFQIGNFYSVFGCDSVTTTREGSWTQPDPDKVYLPVLPVYDRVTRGDETRAIETIIC